MKYNFKVILPLGLAIKGTNPFLLDLMIESSVSPFKIKIKIKRREKKIKKLKREKKKKGKESDTIM